MLKGGCRYAGAHTNADAQLLPGSQPAHVLRRFTSAGLCMGKDHHITSYGLTSTGVQLAAKQAAKEAGTADGEESEDEGAIIQVSEDMMRQREAIASLKATIHSAPTQVRRCSAVAAACLLPGYVMGRYLTAVLAFISLHVPCPYLPSFLGTELSLVQLTCFPRAGSLGIACRRASQGQGSTEDGV